MKHMRLFLYVGIAVATQTPMYAVIDASDLLANSPFVHAKIAPGTQGTGETQPYIFRGVCKIGEDLLINISDTAKKKNYWIKIGDTEGDIKIVSYDGESRRVSILVGARDYTLDLAKPKMQTVSKNQTGTTETASTNNNDNPLRRIRRTRRPGGGMPPIPPPPFMNGNFRRDNMPPNGGVPPWTQNGADSNNPTTRNAEAVRSTNPTATSSSSGTDNSSSTSTDDTPNSLPPGEPPNYVPTIPDSVRQMMESNNTPASPSNQ
jgi:hypothetical protein